MSNDKIHEKLNRFIKKLNCVLDNLENETNSERIFGFEIGPRLITTLASIVTLATKLNDLLNKIIQQ